MSGINTEITITQDANGKFSVVPPPPPPINMDLDDTISFNVVVNAGCTVCFFPTGHFGKGIQLKKGPSSQYSPSKKGTVVFNIFAYGSKCSPRESIETYSIKIG